jgi:hypothetical protein
MKKTRIPKPWYFLIIVMIAYITLLISNKDSFYSCIYFFGELLLKIIPIFVTVFVLMVFTNYFITQKFIIKHTKKKGIKKWFFIIIGGILSSGPVYMWYPLLADLKNKGLSEGFIACFLYNRAIKLPLLPLIILYFGWKFVIVLSLIMIAASVIQGIIINNMIISK